MRILIAVDKYKGGAGNVAQQLASLFSQEEGYEVGLMLLNTSDKPKYDLSKVEIIDRHEYGGHQVPIPQAIVRWFKSHYRLGKMINQWHPDVIVSFLNSISVPLLISQWNTKTPIIVSERSNPYFEWSHNKLSFNIQWFLSYKRANLIVYQFHYFESFLKSQYKNGKTAAIPNMLYGAKTIIEKSKEGDDDNVRFITLASLYPVKRIDLMIDIFAEIHKRYSKTELNIYGSGNESSRLESKVKEMKMENVIHFNGVVTDTYSILAESDIFFLTSEREGFPNSVIEAMSMGVVPIIFKFHEGIKEIVLDGENGFLIDEGDINSFVNKACTLVTNKVLRQIMAQKAVHVSNRYNSSAVFPMWKRAINKAIK